MQLQLVEFTKGCPPYNVGESAGFTAKHAARFVANGVAKLTDSPVRRPNTRKLETDPLTVMRFIRSCAPYGVGETAGFSKGRAAQLAKVGLAEPVKGDELKKLQARLAAKQPPPIKTQGKR